jgi:hypothetical protein
MEHKAVEYTVVQMVGQQTVECRSCRHESNAAPIAWALYRKNRHQSLPVFETGASIRHARPHSPPTRLL